MVNVLTLEQSSATDARTHVGAAALSLVRTHPYLGLAVWGMMRIERPGLGTFAVDKRGRLFYDPCIAVAWTVPEVAGALYHEISHLLRAHADRRPADVNAERWNLAADLEINDDLATESGVVLPSGAVTPEQFHLKAGQLAEAYVRLLPDSIAASNSRVTAGRCGSCSGGPTTDDPVVAADAPEGLNEGELVVLRRRVADAIRQRGAWSSTPGHLKRWADQLLEPRVDWRREFASLVRRAVGDQAGAIDYSYRRPSRRQAGFGRVIHPALRQPCVEVAMVIDTSGSMGTDDLSLAMAEVRGVLQATCSSVGVRVLSVDAAVHANQRVARAEQVVLAGGGGTDMGLGLAAVERLRPRPQVAVVVTDGMTPWPARAPRGVAVVVALTRPAVTPTWARSVVLS
jgi:predicted metal-dependent peptidase